MWFVGLLLLGAIMSAALLLYEVRPELSLGDKYQYVQDARLLRPRSSATTHVPAGSASGRRGGFNFRPPGRVHHPDEPDGLQQMRHVTRFEIRLD